jgi:hypothetical protein
VVPPDDVAALTRGAGVSVRRARGAANRRGEKLRRCCRALRRMTLPMRRRARRGPHLCADAAQPALVVRTHQLDGNLRDAAGACDEYCRLMFRASAWQSASARFARCSIARPRARAAPRVSGDIRIVCKLDTVGGTERRAVNLYQQLSAHARVTLWRPCRRAVHGERRCA